LPRSPMRGDLFIQTFCMFHGIMPIEARVGAAASMDGWLGLGGPCLAVTVGDSPTQPSRQAAATQRDRDHPAQPSTQAAATQRRRACQTQPSAQRIGTEALRLRRSNGQRLVKGRHNPDQKGSWPVLPAFPRSWLLVRLVVSCQGWTPPRAAIAGGDATKERP
jgi:hypothetical protein